MQKSPGVVAFFSAADIPGENSFIPLKSVTITESEVIFIELDTEVSFYGQPVGVIVATTLALANSAVSLVEIVYENSTEKQRSIVPSIFHWRTMAHSNTSETNAKQYRLFPNQPEESMRPSTLSSPKKIEGTLFSIHK